MLFKTIAKGNNIIYTIMARWCLCTYHKSDFRRILIVLSYVFMLLKKNFIICDELQCTSVCSKMFARLFVNSTRLIISAKSEKKFDKNHDIII